MQWNRMRRHLARGLGLGLFVLGLVMASGAGHQWG